MKRVNREGPPLLGKLPRPERLSPSRVATALSAGALVVDTRPAAEFSAAHVPGTLSIPLNLAFTTWAGGLMPYAQDFFLIVDDRCRHCVDEAVRDLSLIGLDRLAGYAGTDILDYWTAAGGVLGRVPQIAPSVLAQKVRAGAVQVLDVRSGGEWDQGHVPGARHVPLGDLADRIGSLAEGKPIVVHCQAGVRSVIAASLLRARGIADVVSLAGGFDEWRASGHPVERDAPHPESMPTSTR
jgi:hydroxyacylglutathione hydrolase